MTIQELLDWCKNNDVPLTTPIAIRLKDDFLLVKKNLSIDNDPYFGNCDHGDAYLDKVAPIDDDTMERSEIPKFLFLGTGRD